MSDHTSLHKKAGLHDNRSLFIFIFSLISLGFTGYCMNIIIGTGAIVGGLATPLIFFSFLSLGAYVGTLFDIIHNIKKDTLSKLNTGSDKSWMDIWAPVLTFCAASVAIFLSTQFVLSGQLPREIQLGIDSNIALTLFSIGLASGLIGLVHRWTNHERPLLGRRIIGLSTAIGFTVGMLWHFNIISAPNVATYGIALSKASIFNLGLIIPTAAILGAAVMDYTPKIFFFLYYWKKHGLKQLFKREEIPQSEQTSESKKARYEYYINHKSYESLGALIGAPCGIICGALALHFSPPLDATTATMLMVSHVFGWSAGISRLLWVGSQLLWQVHKRPENIAIETDSKSAEIPSINPVGYPQLLPQLNNSDPLIPAPQEDEVIIHETPPPLLTTPATPPVPESPPLTPRRDDLIPSQEGEPDASLNLRSSGSCHSPPSLT